MGRRFSLPGNHWPDSTFWRLRDEPNRMFRNPPRFQTPFGNASIETPFRELNPMRRRQSILVYVRNWRGSSLKMQ